MRLIASWNGTKFCFLLFSGQHVVYILERSRTKQLLKGSVNKTSEFELVRLSHVYAGRQIDTYSWQVHYNDDSAASKAIPDLSVEYIKPLKAAPTALGLANLWDSFIGG